VAKPLGGGPFRPDRRLSDSEGHRQDPPWGGLLIASVSGSLA
jgi:hypothetical protein